MPRPLLKKNVQQRIKANKKVMQRRRKQVTDFMTAATKGEVINAALARSAFSEFVKASQAITEDTAKLLIAE